MKCSHCDREVELPYQCSFCRNYFCVEHRLPENHKCVQAPARTPLGSWQAKQRAITKPKSKRGKVVSNGDSHFEKRELPLFDLKHPHRKSKSRIAFLEKRRKKRKGVKS